MGSFETLLYFLLTEKAGGLVQHWHDIFHTLSNTTCVRYPDIKSWFSEAICGSVTFLGFLNQQMTYIGSKSSVLIKIFHYFFFFY